MADNVTLRMLRSAAENDRDMIDVALHTLIQRANVLRGSRDRYRTAEAADLVTLAGRIVHHVASLEATMDAIEIVQSEPVNASNGG